MTETTMSQGEPQHVLDVSKLPSGAMDSRAPLWWGNLLLLFIETMTVGIMVVTYFYVRRNFGPWPPPRADQFPTNIDPNPGLAAATANLVMLALSCGVMYWTDLRARAHDARRTLMGLGVMFAVSAVAMVLTYFECKAIHFRWDDNAYASVLWVSVFLHGSYILAGLVEFGLMFAWVARHGIDEKHALDVTLAGGYWYWVAGTWVVFYSVMFVGPRIM